MKMRAVALLALAAGSTVSLAAPQEPQSFAGPYSVYAPAADPLNTTVNVTFAGTGGYTAAGFRITATVDRQNEFTWAADIQASATAPSGEVYNFAISGDDSVGIGAVSTQIIYGFAPAAPVNPFGTWTIRFGDTLLDGTAGVNESIISNVVIALEDNTAPASTAVDMTTAVGSRTDTYTGAEGVKWFLVNAPAAQLASNTYFEIFSGGTVADTELGLYSTTGARLDVDFVDGDGEFAALSWGRGSGENLGLVDGARGVGQDGDLAAGTYYLGVSTGERAWFPGLWYTEEVTAGAAGDVSLTWRSGTRTLVIPAPVTSAGNNPASFTDAVATGPKWYTVSVSGVNSATRNYFDIWTVAGGEDDTEIGMYRPNGTLVASDDDAGPGFLSLLSWGGGGGLAAGSNGQGANGTTLADGTYYVVAGSFNMVFNADFFDFTGGAGADFTLNMARGVRPLASTPTPAADLGLDPNVVRTGDTGLIWLKLSTSEINAFSGRYFDIRTFSGGVDDTEIGLFDNNGVVVVSNDDYAPDFDGSSLLSFGSGSPTPSATGQNGGLAAGTYWLAAGLFNMVFTNDFAVTGGAGGAFDLTFVSGTSAAPGGTPPATFTDLGTLGNATVTRTETLGAGEIKWFRVVAPSAASTGNGIFLDVWTAQAPGSLLDDTELGLYSTDGRFVSDDDDDIGFFSALSFGAGGRLANGTGVAFNGRDGSLPAGTYYLSLSEWDTIFAPSFSVTTTGTTDGDTILNLRSNFGPVACGASDVAGPGQVVGADGTLTADDIIVFIGWFFANDARADVAGSGQTIGADGSFTADDIIIFINRFFAGC